MVSNNGATYHDDLGHCRQVRMVTISQAGNSDYTGGANSHREHYGGRGDFPDGERNCSRHGVLRVRLYGGSNHQRQHDPDLTVAPATVCTISGATVTMIKGTGTCTVTAEWAADDVLKAATGTGNTTAEKVASVVTWATPAPITYGISAERHSTGCDSQRSGHVLCYTPVSGKVLAGRQTLSVRFTPTSTRLHNGNGHYVVALVVNPANTTTSITSITPVRRRLGS